MEACGSKITSFQNFELILKFQKVLMFFEVMPTRRPCWSDSEKKFPVKPPCCDATKSTFPLSVDVETVPYHDSVRTSFWAWKLPLQSDLITRKKFGTFIHFEIFALLRPPPVKNGMDCALSYNFSFELRCGIRTYLEAGRFCAVDYESFGT